MYRNFYTDETALAVCLKETMYVCMQLYSRNIFRNKRLLRCEVCFSQHYLRYIRGLPINDTPEIFALHENANITFAQNETFSLLRGILKMQPRSSSGSGRSREEVCVRNGVTCNAGAYSWRQVTGGGGDWKVKEAGREQDSLSLSPSCWSLFRPSHSSSVVKSKTATKG